MMARVGAMTAPLINGLVSRVPFLIPFLVIGLYNPTPCSHIKGDLGNPNLPFSVFGICGIIGSVSAIVLPETLDRPLAQNIFEADKLNQMR